jgi:small subunit ribosomal protein S4
MARYTGPKNRIARRFGANVFGRARNPLLHKPNPPGQHGVRRRKKSDYGLQLDEQQKLKAVYGMLTRKQLVNYYRKALTYSESTTTVFQRLLECRLDNIVYRLKFAPTIFAAQQLVSHGHISVNGKKVDIRSFQVEPGMTVAIREKSRNVAAIKQAIASAAREIPPYLELVDEFEGKLVMTPQPDQITFSLPIKVPVICDFLAHTS